jgi:hypothetical protein
LHPKRSLAGESLIRIANREPVCWIQKQCSALGGSICSTFVFTLCDERSYCPALLTQDRTSTESVALFRLRAVMLAARAWRMRSHSRGWRFCCGRWPRLPEGWTAYAICRPSGLDAARWLRADLSHCSGGGPLVRSSPPRPDGAGCMVADEPPGGPQRPPTTRKEAHGRP